MHTIHLCPLLPLACISCASLITEPAGPREVPLDLSGKTATLKTLRTLIKDERYDLIPACFSRRVRPDIVEILSKNRDAFCSTWGESLRLCNLSELVDKHVEFAYDGSTWRIDEM